MNKLICLIQELCPNGVEYLPLEKCCTILDNKRKPVTKAAREAGEYPYYGANGIQDYVSDYIFNGTFVLVGEDGSVITSNGTPVVTWATGKIWVNNHAHIISEIDGVLLRYLFHYLQTVNVTPLIHGNIPKLTGGDFRALRIPLPPLAVQQEIVRILDSFTELTAELTARRKQYEHYRDELLTFGDDVERLPVGEVCDTITDYVAAGSFADIKKHVKYNSNNDYAQLIRTTDLKNNFTKADFVYISESAFDFLKKVNLDRESIVLPNVGNCGEVYYIEPTMLPHPHNVIRVGRN